MPLFPWMQGAIKGFLFNSMYPSEMYITLTRPMTATILIEEELKSPFTA